MFVAFLMWNDHADVMLLRRGSPAVEGNMCEAQRLVACLVAGGLSRVPAEAQRRRVSKSPGQGIESR